MKDQIKFEKHSGSYLTHSKGGFLRFGKKLFRVEYVKVDDELATKFDLYCLPVLESDVIAGVVTPDYEREVLKKIDRSRMYDFAFYRI
jgi:hypothetical protein